MTYSNVTRVVRRRKSRPGTVTEGPGRRGERAGAEWDAGLTGAHPAAEAIQRECAECAEAERSGRNAPTHDVLTEDEARAGGGSGPRVARQAVPEEEEQVQPARQALARQAEEEEEEQAQTARDALARQEEEEEEEAQAARQEAEEEEQVQSAREDGAAPARRGDASAARGPISAQLRQARGAGRELDAGTRRFMESRFGTDLSSVRIHTDTRADALARRLGARAFTNGDDVYFRAGSHDTSRSKGLKLIAHELTHVVQQRGETVSAAEHDPPPARRGPRRRRGE